MGEVYAYDELRPWGFILAGFLLVGAPILAIYRLNRWLRG